MAERSKGLLPFAGSFEVESATPLDARMVTTTRASLYSPDTWRALDGNLYTYVGMRVTVTADPTATNNGVYWLRAADFTTQSNWQKIDGAGAAAPTAAAFIID